MIAIIDYGMGNVASIYNMLDHLNIDAVITSDPTTILEASHLILPGVGAFDHAMEILVATKLDQTIKAFATTGKPLLGICLGMQLLGVSSEEGQREGLGLIPFLNKRFPKEQLGGLRIPHMGWNTVKVIDHNSISQQLRNESRFYFVHSYYAANVPSEYQWLEAEYGIPFTAAVRKDNIFGTQFHPEKSHLFGMALLQAFAEVA
jgi:imidazole glycerol-phosphate synthase subunit HisH